MTLRKKNAAIAMLTAALMASGVITTANAAVYDADSGRITVQKGARTDVDIKTEKTTASGSDGYITFNSAIPVDDTLIVHIRNKNDNVVSTDDGRWRGVSAGTKKSLHYQSGKGVKGNVFYPSFSLATGSRSTTLTVSYKFQP